MEANNVGTCAAQAYGEPSGGRKNLQELSALYERLYLRNTQDFSRITKFLNRLAHMFRGGK
ncbi:hypothetical protein [Nocardia vaccinii]|uniref:hypothetical protein n=1 Tax=Nocardia vaccinii TaxID=1822 RepID=UPI00082E9B46|nr:hypothetical protein [Nocardia vaccinii]